MCLHQEDKSFDLLGLSCLKTSCGVAECREVQITWPGQRSILYPVLKSYYFNVPEEYPVGPLRVRILKGMGACGRGSNE